MEDKNIIKNFVIVCITVLIAITIMASCDYKETKLKIINNYIEKK